MGGGHAEAPVGIGGSRMSSKQGFLVASANTPWVYGLAETLAERGHPSAAVTLYDWRNYRQIQPRWPNAHCPPLLARSHWVYPPGYMGVLEPIVRPLLRNRWHGALDKLKAAGAPEPWTVCPYPWLIDSLKDVCGDRLIYFNLDPYQLYRPERADRIMQ